MITCAEHFNVAEVHGAAARLPRWRAPWSRVTRTEPEVFAAYGEENAPGGRDGLRREAEHDRVPAPPGLPGRRSCPPTPPPETVLSGGFDGVMLSNGPGDPADNMEIIAELRKLYDSDHPHLRRLPGPPASGPGHRRQDPAGWPMATGAATTRCGTWRPGGCFITSQNHGYVVLADTRGPGGGRGIPRQRQRRHLWRA